MATVLAAATLAWAFAPRPVEVETATAAVGPFELTIDEDGRTRLPDRYLVSAPLAGRVARIGLRAGDAVEAGAVVATLAPVLSPMLDERAAREAQARVEAAAALLQRASARVERAAVAVEQARNEARRSEQLAREGFLSPSRLETDRLGVRAAAGELEAAQQERHVARHDLEQARAALGAMRPSPAAPARAFEVRSPVAGQVLRVLQASEGTVAAGTPLLEVGQLDTLEVVVELLTTDAPRAQSGTPVRFERWGGEGVLEGRVVRIEPAAFTKVSALGVEEQRVNLIADVSTPRAKWRALGDGFRVGARIVVTAVDQALLVPSSAVFPMPEGDDHQMAAFVVDRGRATLVPVTLAGRNSAWAWIAQGLTAGAKVVVYPPPAVRDGVRVRERKV
ncbi:HlyD family efflux transporter periplasmic adaptor subunit [Aquabacterium sp. J223]|uniref:efflux RND transporter periplasmic adaptor subunit n=1 Tax=Aquabacterium sp. J223 TaxID=2898431 RepID=UPI0028A0C8D8|nr:HlyD family efflux transporter periplasmic adaptor subunit [Aquabacterium sp. J223]